MHDTTLRNQVRGSTPARRGVNLHDVLFRLAAGCFATWVVASWAVAPISHPPPTTWLLFLALGGVVALTMLFAGIKTLHHYLRQR